MHSQFAPSKMTRIVLCPGSVQLCAQVPQKPTSEYAAEGTLLHEYMAKADDIGAIEAFGADVLTGEQKAVLYEAWDFVQSIKESQIPVYGPVVWSAAEQRVAFKSQPEIFGTADYIIGYEHHLDVFDYKFGRSVEVDLNDNFQLISYGIGALDLLAPDQLENIKNVTVWIIQPRMENYCGITYTVSELREYEKQIIRAVELSKGKESCLNPGGKQCQWCDAAAVCPALHAQVHIQAGRVFEFEAELDIRPLSDEQIMEFYNSIPTLKAAIKRVDDYVMAQLLRGKEMPGYKLVRTRANRSWKSESEAIDWLMTNATDFGVDCEDMIITKCISPAQAEKLLRGVKKNAEFTALYHTPDGKLKIAPIDDARPAASISAEDAFSNYKEHDDDEGIE